MPNYTPRAISPPRGRPRFRARFGGFDPRSELIGGEGEVGPGGHPRFPYPHTTPGGSGPGDIDIHGWPGPGPSPTPPDPGGQGTEFVPDPGDGYGPGTDTGDGGEGGGEGGGEIPGYTPPPGLGSRGFGVPGVPSLPEVPGMPSLDREMPDFEALASMREATVGPEYETPEGAFKGEEMYGPLKGFAESVLANPSRFDIPVVERATALINENLAEKREESLKGLAEFASQRGHVGSSIEMDHRRELEEDLDRSRRQRLSNLEQLMAVTQARDRSTAANIARSAGEFGRGLGADRRSEAHFAHGAKRQRGRDLESDRRFRTELGLRGAGMAEDAYMGRERFTEGARRHRFGAGMDRARTGFGMEMDRFGAQEGQFRHDAGYGLNRYNAGVNAQLGFGNMGLRRDQFGLQQDRFDFDKEIQRRQLELQEQGMSQDEAYRQARLELAEKELGLREDRYVNEQRMQHLSALAALLQKGTQIDDETKDEILSWIRSMRDSQG